VHYNLGNAYYRLNEIGPSVLHYQKALHLKAGYKEAADNLSLVESRIGNRVQTVPDIFFVQWWNSVTQGSKANIWASATLVLFLAWIAILIAKRFNRILYIAPQLHIAIGLVLFLLLSISLISALNRQDSAMAVVMNNDTPFMAAPQSGKPQSLLPEGTTIKWKSAEGKWVNIVLPDGRTGWIEADNLAKI
jgi:tetratricopeptide (TPR) repeat protein